jgi:ABC-type microcin C transport system permease subunit YejB
MNGLAAFVMRRSVTVILTLAVVVAIIVAILQFGLCAQVDAKLVEIRQQIEQEIIAKKIIFDTPEERQAYIDQRTLQEIRRLGLDACV